MTSRSAVYHLQAGREALRIALQEEGVDRPVEDSTPDAEQLQTARRHFESAASILKVAGRSREEACVYIELAGVHLKMPPSEENCAAAEASCRAALELLDSAEDAGTCLNGYLLLMDAIALRINHAPAGFEKERLAKQALGLLRAAGHLARGQEDPLPGARVDELLSRIYGERFGTDRDANLLEAIRAGQRALPAFLVALQTSPLSYPSLQVHLGNCYMKLDGPRERWIQEGLLAYREGLAAVDPRQAPRLHGVLTGNVEMAEALIAEGNSSLPEKEMMERFGMRLQSALDGGDMAGAQVAAWDAIRWGWSLDRAPNIWVAEAHKQLGALLLHEGDAGRARNHFYSAVALLSAMDDPTHPRQAALLGGARQYLGEAMAQLGQADHTAELLKQAELAFIAARRHCARGSELIASTPEAAHEEFEQALALFSFDPLALFYRGAASMTLSRFEEACRDFDSVLMLQPRHVGALTNRGAMKMQMGDNEAALADYGSALDIDPQNVVALYNRAVLHAAAGDYATAIADINHLLEAHPEVTAAHTLRAECQARLQRTCG